MPEYLSPGVYVEEIQTGPRPIEGVGTSTAGFAGMTERGPESPRLIGSWLEFQRWYGQHDEARSYMSFAVQGFFDNGGQRCFVTRVVANDGQTPIAPAQATLNGLQFFAVGRGVWGNNISVVVREASSARPERFRITMYYYKDSAYYDNFVDPLDAKELVNPKRRTPDVLEDYDEIESNATSSRFFENVINVNSKLARVVYDNTTPPDKNGTRTQFGGGADAGNTVRLSDFVGSTDQPVLDVVRGGNLLGRGWGLDALKIVDEIALLLAPDEVKSTDLRNALVDQCELLKDRFAVLSITQGKTDAAAAKMEAGGRDTSYAGIYYPWIEVFDPFSNKPVLIPPAGHVAGIMARTDIARGVHKAPANEVVRGVRKLEFPVTKASQDILNPIGVNCIRDFTSDRRGIRLWGARTMSSDGMWKYVNVRRLFIFVEESIEEGTQFVVFEPNDESTWSAVRRTIRNFLTRVWRDGALMGAIEEEAFFVKCDRTTMTQDDIDNGRLICYIGIAPVKPAEFVIFRISQKTADSES